MNDLIEFIWEILIVLVVVGTVIGIAAIIAATFGVEMAVPFL